MIPPLLYYMGDFNVSIPLVWLLWEAGVIQHMEKRSLINLLRLCQIIRLQWSAAWQGVLIHGRIKVFSVLAENSGCHGLRAGYLLSSGKQNADGKIRQSGAVISEFLRSEPYPQNFPVEIEL